MFPIGVRVHRKVNRHVDIAVAAKGIGFADKPSVLDSDALLALAIQFPCQQFSLQFLDDAREANFQTVYCLLFSFTNQ